MGGRMGFLLCVGGEVMMFVWRVLFVDELD